MLKCIINEQGNYLDVREDISEKKKLFFSCLPINISGALILEIIVIADNKKNGPVLQML